MIKEKKSISVIGNYYISTVFIYFDHEIPGTPPSPDPERAIFLETIVFLKLNKIKSEVYHERYSTYKDATEGHRRCIISVRNRFKKEASKID